VETEEETAPWWWIGRAVVDMAMPWMASSAMALGGASAQAQGRGVLEWWKDQVG
jgi:hypothetical protein